ncbi:zinc ribbon domain-containing protein [Actinophytocola xanthii]|uniref:Zinc-ribbon domain-containing protein n=1 Tax=Actinophytocola xanthii TaxID=1912961 RepID=A0A1Q8CTK5_9PSEU|nr:zinc-ribbon domain-containing protein [Actinophytocola xanthii]OLF17673.1 zinc-ribbon domain-containing protein [Actinophytocola xanthii]
MVIFGFRTKVVVLAMLTLLCPGCGNRAAHPLRRAVTKFTLFFISLFPVRTARTTQCTFCGLTSRVSRDQASQLLGQAGERPGTRQYPPQG